MKAQSTKSNIIGKWKLTRIAFPSGLSFDTDSLTSSYKQFFNKQKQEAYKGKITENDSLFIQYQFEKAVNDVSKMFIEFRNNNVYVTNHYEKGELTDKAESGKYNYNSANKTITAYVGNSKRVSAKYKISQPTTGILILKSNDGTIMKCKKIKE